MRVKVKATGKGWLQVSCPCGMVANVPPARQPFGKHEGVEGANDMARRHATGHAIVAAIDVYERQVARFGGTLTPWLRDA